MKSRVVITFLIKALVLSILTVGIVTYLESLSIQEWWITAIVVSVFYGLPMLYWLKTMNKNYAVSNKQIIGFLVILLALPIFAYAYFGTQIPETSMSVEYQESINYSIGNINSTATFLVVYNFNAIGSFSVENPIHVKATVLDSNVTDLTQYIDILCFTGALSYPVQTSYLGGPLNAHFNLTQVGNNEYSTEGNMIWYQSVDTHDAWLAPNATVFNQDYWQGRGDVILDISSISDKLTLDSSQTMEQLTYVLVGFSVLMSYPIFVELIPESPKPAPPEVSGRKGGHKTPDK